ncbi:NeuD/PglB/VioB family sugar acetyltransferase [Frankia casuarinae]|uniref:UDP-3-O-(3-hydroxymyristoyl)-like n=1 Tax=Frankia casuarinae (strain DSM 45818 / CECT 9043 / HFP020203 / CcI3) TaxID=106370 RepID=Q2J7B3_FRACC|nr:NeuD/PglB/VioB family sugar acetyltransferase [Frankia casuarinae]ABD12829.1 UDP-3-O-(3-hydroxymyristoyl)-like [Frankia casuarinae]
MPAHLRSLVIVGAGGHGRELLDLVEAVNAATEGPRYDILGFVDDDRVDPDPLARRGAVLLGGLDLLDRLDADYLIGFADAATRSRVDRYASARGRRPATLVHPRASVGGDVKLGPGTVVCALASITTNVETGRHVVVNIGASVAHDCRLGDYVTVAPGARLSGAVAVGARAWIGAQASIVGLRSIGDGAVVGAGSVVTDDIRAAQVVAGVPARPIHVAPEHVAPEHVAPEHVAPEHVAPDQPQPESGGARTTARLAKPPPSQRGAPPCG